MGGKHISHVPHTSLLNVMRLVSGQLSTIAFLLGLFFVLSGCLQTRIVTDEARSAERAEIPWAHGFVYGLVPPVNAPLQAEATCGPAGVAQVYFRQEFVQVIAQALTGSIYSPQRLTAMCAGNGGMATVPGLPSSLPQGPPPDRPRSAFPPLAFPPSASAPLPPQRIRDPQ